MTPDTRSKTRFVIVDAVGVTESELSDSYSLNKDPYVAFETLLDLVSKGSRHPEVISTLASRLTRLDSQLTPKDRERIKAAAHGTALSDIVRDMVDAVDADRALEGAKEATGQQEPPQEAVKQAEKELLEGTVRPIASNPELRQLLIDIRKSYEQTIDTVSLDNLIEAGYSADATESARRVVESFEKFIEENRDEITALQVLYSRPYSQRLTYQDIRALADTLQTPPRSWTSEKLWTAYQQLDRSKVRGSGQRVLADIVSLVRFAVHQDEQLVPFAERVRGRFEGWLAMQETSGRAFTPEQRRWLEDMRDHIAGSVSIDMSDLELAPFIQRGGVGAAYTLFGSDLPELLDELNRELVA